METKKCAWCEQEFVPKNKKQKFCRHQCNKGMAEHTARKKEPAKWREKDRIRNEKRKGYRQEYRDGKGKDKCDQKGWAHHLMARYGITVGDYDRMLESQRGVCKICGKQEKTIRLRTGTPLRLSVDHDHATGEIRGILCKDCNKGIGCFGDNVELIEKAILYLKDTSRPQMQQPNLFCVESLTEK